MKISVLDPDRLTYSVLPLGATAARSPRLDCLQAL